MSGAIFLHSACPLSPSEIPEFLGPDILSASQIKAALEEQVHALPGGEKFAEEARTAFIEEGVRLFKQYGLKKWEDATPDFCREFLVTHQTRISKLQEFLSNELFKKCATCKQVSETPLKLCGRCRKISYCSKECQTADWKRHRREDCLAKQ